MIQSLQWDDLVETACARQPRWTPGGSDSGEWAHSSPGLTETEKSLGQPSCGMEADSSLCGRHLLTCMRRENVWHQSAKLKREVGWIYRFEARLCRRPAAARSQRAAADALRTAALTECLPLNQVVRNAPEFLHSGA